MSERQQLAEAIRAAVHKALGGPAKRFQELERTPKRKPRKNQAEQQRVSPSHEEAT